MRVTVYFSAFVAFVLSSCRKDVGYISPGGYPPEIGGIVLNHCATAGCHESGDHPPGHLDLSSWQNLFKGSHNGAVVVPYSSRFSSLTYFINTYEDLGPRAHPTMPYNRDPLPYTDVKKIKDWIDAGAPDASGKVMWAGDPGRRKLYAVNQGCDVVTVFDGGTGLPMRYVEVGTKPGSDTPHHIRVSPKGDFWYVIFINNNIMQKFRCSDDSHVADIPLSPLAAGTGATDASNWNTFAISPDGRKAWCVSWTQNGSLASVDLENGKLLAFLGGQHYPHAVALSKTGDRLFVGAHTGNFITAFDTSLMVEGTRYSLDPGVPPSEAASNNPHDMVLSPDGSELWITCLGTKDIRVFNTISNAVTKVIPAAGAPFEIVYSGATKEYFASCTNDSLTFPGHLGVITRVKAEGFAVSHLPVGNQPHGMAVDEHRRVLYVLSRNISGGDPPHHSSQCAGRNGFVQFVDLHSFTVTDKKYELSVDPYFIYARP